MSWQAASFAVLAAVLVGGFAWYERSRPPSQIVALVAALAAVAVAGRVLLAAIPNVVATTDIVLFAGYAIGAAPGFAVGALAALVSNFWLGQGPWTPWQMAGWGMAGVLGAWLAVATRGRAGRLSLAAACALAAVAFGALMNFSLMASYGGEMSFERFLALESRAVPFDAAHAIGNVALALVAGPAIVRMLVRFRDRFEWQRAEASRPRLAAGAVGLLLALALVPLAAPASAAEPAARSWLASAQNPDGGFPSDPGQDSSVVMTGWAMLGLEAAGRNPLDVRRRGNSAVDFLRANEDAISSTGDLGRTILALEGAGVDARRFAGRNLVAELRARRRADGSYEGWPNSTAFAVLALRSAGSRGVGRSLRWLRRVQNRDGGWGVVPRAASDPDSTGAVLQAVRGSRAARRGVRYLRRQQVGGGGWRLGGSGAVNSQSTAWALQGLVAAGVAPGSVREGGRSGLDYLARRQASDGHYRYSRISDQTPVWVTAQALVAVNGSSFPLDPVPRRPRPRTSTPTRDPVPSPAPGPLIAPASPAATGSAQQERQSGRARSGSADGAPVRADSARASGAAGARTDHRAERVASEQGGPAGAAQLEVDSASASGDRTGGDGGDPVTALMIGLAAGGTALAGTVWLGRRRYW